MKQTKILLVVLALALFFSGCADQTEPQTTQSNDEAIAEATAEPTAEPTSEPIEVVSAEPVKIATLAGPTGMGLIQLIDDTTGTYEASIFTSPDQIVPKIINNEVNIASVPSNLGSVLYNKTKGEWVALSVNTLGVLYIVENGDTVNSFSDLSGKTLYATGQGASPEYVLNNITAANELDVDVQYLAQHADLANQVVAGDVKLALLPEPFVSMVTIKNQDVKVKLALNDAWMDIYGDDSSIPMSVTLVNKTYLENNADLVAQFMADYEASVKFVNDDKDAASELIVNHGIIGAAPIAKKAIDGAKISFITGDDAKTMLETYLGALFESNPQSVGGALPGEDFYK